VIIALSSLELAEIVDGKSSSLLKAKTERDIVFEMVGRDILVLARSWVLEWCYLAWRKDLTE
jgi:hypothetical protein